MAPMSAARQTPAAPRNSVGLVGMKAVSVRLEAALEHHGDASLPTSPNRVALSQTAGRIRLLKSVFPSPFPEIAGAGTGTGSPGTLKRAKSMVSPGRSETSQARPFSRSSERQYAGSLSKIVQQAKSLTTARSQPEMSEVVGSPMRANIGTSPSPSEFSHKFPPSRTDAVLLCEAYDLLFSNIGREMKGDLTDLAFRAANEANPEQLMRILEPQLFVIDTVLVELMNQISSACIERGYLLERIRRKVLEFFSFAAVALREQQAQGVKVMETNNKLQEDILRFRSEHTHAIEKMAAVAIEMKGLQETNKRLTLELETVKRKSQTVTAGLFQVRSSRELELELKLQETTDILSLCKSKLGICSTQLQTAEANNGILQMQILDLKERIRRDTEQIECLAEEKARYKIRSTWLRSILLIRRAPREMQDSATQDGPGIKANIETKVSANTLEKEEDHNAEPKSPIPSDASRSALFGKDAVLSFSAFWDGVVSNASSIDLELDAPHMRMEKRELLEFISKIYTEKILVDEQDSRAHFPRETLPEYLYEYHLEALGDCNKAFNELVRVVANLRSYLLKSARARMFGRFCLLVPQDPVIPEALHVYLLALVKLQGGSVPLLPSYDGVHVSAEKALQTVEYIFSQAPYVVRSKLLLEVEKRVQGKKTDIDSLLSYIVEQFMNEAGKSEERLKAIFVAADTDNNGQLDYSEYFKMMKHLGLIQNYRRLIRMYTEMTLNRSVNSVIFVHVCRKWKAFLFEPGPAVKKMDKKTLEVFSLLTVEWDKMEAIVHELLLVLEGTPVGQRLEDHIRLFKQKLGQKLEVEQAWHCYRSILAEFTSAVKNRTPPEIAASSFPALNPATSPGADVIAPRKRGASKAQ